jgi:site-specific DNA recombinase
MVTQEQFDQAQERLTLNRQLARRNNKQHKYLLRGLLSCGLCRLSCMGRSGRPDYSYYVCQGKWDALRISQGRRCASRYVPGDALDELVWQDLCHLMTHPELITQALARARSGEWLPQQMQARRKTLEQALTQLGRQDERLLEAYLAEIIALPELERKRQEMARKHQALLTQLRQLDAQVEKRVEVTTIAASIKTFCQRVEKGLALAAFSERRQLVELLIDRVIVDDDQVEIRYVIPTSEAGTQSHFCHLRTDYFPMPAQQGIGLGDVQRLLPEVGAASE